MPFAMLEMLMLHQTPSSPSTVALRNTARGMRAAFPMIPASVGGIGRPSPWNAPEEVIFTTGLIPPGMSCSKVTLTRPLEKGEYPAVLRVQPYRMNDSRTPTNNAELDIVLTVR